MSVRRAQQEIDAEEFSNWLSYFRMETWDSSGYHQSGIICATMANMLGNEKAVAADFMPLEHDKGSKPEEAQKTLELMFGG